MGCWHETRGSAHSGVTLSPSGLVEKQEAYEDLLSVVNYFSLKLVDLLSDIPILITVSDNEGFILNLVGDELIKKTIIDLKITPVFNLKYRRWVRM